MGAPRQHTQSARPHRAEAVRPDCKLTASALFGPRPMTDSPALPPLHSTPRPLQVKQAPAAFVPTAANWRDSQEQLGRSRRPRHQWPRGFARPGRSSSREPGQLSLARNRPASLIKPHWSDTSPPGFSRNCRSRPFTLASQFSRSALSLKSQIRWLALSRLRRASRPADPAKTASARGWLSRTSASRCEHKSVLCVIPPQCRIPLPREPSALSPRRLIAYASSVGLRRPGVLNITASCVHSRLLHCHTHCSPHLALVRAVRAPVRRHRSRQLRRSPEKEQPGLLTPSPRPTPMLDPFRPQVVFARKELARFAR